MVGTLIIAAQEHPNESVLASDSTVNITIPPMCENTYCETNKRI